MSLCVDLAGFGWDDEFAAELGGRLRELSAALALGVKRAPEDPVDVRVEPAASERGFVLEIAGERGVVIRYRCAWADRSARGAGALAAWSDVGEYVAPTS